jgi:hypothetical protein
MIFTDFGSLPRLYAEDWYPGAAPFQKKTATGSIHAALRHVKNWRAEFDKLEPTDKTYAGVVSEKKIEPIGASNFLPYTLLFSFFFFLSPPIFHQCTADVPH